MAAYRAGLGKTPPRQSDPDQPASRLTLTTHKGTTMSAQNHPITERQLDLITRAHCDASGLIEPLLELKGGAKLKMIASLAQRGSSSKAANGA